MQRNERRRGAVKSHSDLTADPTGGRNADVDHDRAFVDGTGKPQGRAMTRSGAGTCVQHRGPDRGHGVDGSGEGAVDPGEQQLPPAVHNLLARL